jgi:hypothetical protein
MPEFNIRSDSVNVEQIMEQIRARIREKRGVDYTEEQIRELAAVKLQKFLDPRGVRSDLLDQFRRAQPPYEPPALPNYAFEEQTLYESHRAPLRWIRRLLRPVLKLFFNPNPLIQALHIQSQVNAAVADREARREGSRRAMEQLYYEVLHNLVLETTRMSIEVANLKMKVESLTGRLEFNERRARALESVVAYKPSDEGEPESAAPERERAASPPQAVVSTGATAAAAEGPGQRSRRRRRRRGRRGGGSVAALMGGGLTPSEVDRPDTSDEADARSADTDRASAEQTHTVESLEHALAAEAQPSEAEAPVSPPPALESEPTVQEPQSRPEPGSEPKGSGQAPSTSSGQAPSTSSGQADGE